MPYFAVYYTVADDFLARRGTFREEHLRLAREANARGELLLAGALSEPADGALLVFSCTDRSIAESFARQDPYVISGVVKKWEVRPWNVIIGNK